MTQTESQMRAPDMAFLGTMSCALASKVAESARQGSEKAEIAIPARGQ